MRFISTRAHAIIDYVMGVVLIITPYVLGFSFGGPAQWTLQGVGLCLIIMALLTDYEYAAIRLIPVPVHLFLDVAAGLFLIVAPWLFGFAALVAWPHVVLGVLEIGAGIFTSTVPTRSPAGVTQPGATADHHHH